jgi:hypothetical protein
MAVIAVGGLLGGVLAAGGATAATRAAAPTVKAPTVKADTVIPISAGLGAGRAHNVSQIPTGLVATKSGVVYVADAEGFLRALVPGTRTETYVAGSVAGTTANGAKAPAALLNPDEGGASPLGIATDPAGDVVVAIASLDIVRVLAASSGTRYGVSMTKNHIYTVAGQLGDSNGGHGFTGGGGVATAATLDGPEAVTIDRAGDILIADTGDNEVQVVAAKTGQHFGVAMTVGHIYTVAGDGTAGTTVNGTKAITGELDQPDGLTVTPLGVAVANDGSSQIAVLATSTGHEYGVSMPTTRDLYVVVNTAAASGATGDGGAATAATLDKPGGLATDHAGDLFVADTGNHEVRAVAAETHAIFGSTDAKGDIYRVAGSGTSGASGNNGLATAAQLNFPLAVAIDASGNLLIGDPGTANVDVVAATTGKSYGQKTKANHLYYIAGNGLYLSSGYDAPALLAEYNEPVYNAIAPNGDVVYADLGTFGVQEGGPNRAATKGDASQRYSIGTSAAKGVRPQFSHPDGPGVNGTRIRLVATKGGRDFGRGMIAGDVYTIGGGPPFDGDPPTGQLGGSYGFAGAVGVAYDHSGNVIVSDDFFGFIDVIAATTGTFYGKKMTAGHVYHIGGIGTGDLARPKIDLSTPALDAEINSPGPLAVDGAGNILVGELGVFEEDTVVNPVVAVIAAKTGTYYQQAMTAGDIYNIAGDGTGGDTGDGSPATAAEIASPYGLAVDRAGDVAIDSTISGADEEDSASTVRFIAEKAGEHFGQTMAVGDIYTVAGTSGPPADGSGNGGPAVSATLGSPGGLAFTADGSLIAGDNGLAEIRLIAASNGIRFGIAMSANDIYAIVGNGAFGRTAYPAKGTADSVDDVFGLAVAPTGKLVFDDEFQGIIAGVTNK